MQRGVLLGAAAVLVLGGAVVLRSVTHRRAGRVVDQGIEQLLTRLPPGYAIAHGPVAYNPLTGTATLRKLVLSRNGAQLLLADEATVGGADEPALRDVFDPAAYPDGHPAWTERRRLLSDLTLTGLRLPAGTPGGPSVTIGSVTLHRLSGRPFAMPPTPTNRLTPAFMADAALALAADSLTVLDVMGNAPAPQPATFGIARFKASNYDGGKLDAAVLDHIDLDTAIRPANKPVHAALDSMDVKGLDARAALAAVRQANAADRSMLSKLAYQSLGVSGGLVRGDAGPSMTLHDLHIDQGAGATDRASQGWLHGLVMDLGQSPISPAAQPALDAFGARSIAVDIDAHSRASVPVRHIDLDETIVLQNLGSLHVQAALDGLDAMQAHPQGNTATAWQAVTLDHATLAWTDNSLVDRAFKVAAVQMHATPEMVRAQLAMPIAALGVMVPDQPDAADQVTAFLNHPHTLTVTLSPPQAVRLGDLADAPVTARAHLLGAHIAAD